LETVTSMTHKLIYENMIPLCPECLGQRFTKDFIHDEISCRRCGLVIIAPFTPNVVCKGFKLLHVKIYEV